MVVALPNRHATDTTNTVNLPGGNGFEIADDRPDRSGWGTVGAIDVGWHRTRYVVQGRGILVVAFWQIDPWFTKCLAPPDCRGVFLTILHRGGRRWREKCESMKIAGLACNLRSHLLVSPLAAISGKSQLRALP